MFKTTQQYALALVCIALLGLVYGAPLLLKVFKGLAGMFRRSFGRGTLGITIAGMRISDSERLRHTHILGATGTGKTVLLESLISEDLARGYGMVIIDPKGDRELFERVKAICKQIGRESDLNLLSANYPDESVGWNPCRLGAATEIQSKFINSWEFSEVFYAKSCEAVLLEALNLFGSSAFNLSDLTTRIREIAEKRKDDSARALALDLFNMVEGEWGEILCAKATSRKEINFLDVIRKNEILFVDLPTEGKSVQSGRIGKLLLQEIMLVSGMRKTFPQIKTKTPFSIFVDEFDAFATQSFATFLNKGRSSGFMIHISHQTLSDLKRVDNGIGVFLGQVQGNINNRFYFRIDDPEDAEGISAFFGTKLTTKTTSRVVGGMTSGDGSIRETLEFRIHPDTIKSLEVGTCVFSSKTSRRLSLLKIPMTDSAQYRRRLPLLRSRSQVVEPAERLNLVSPKYAAFIKKKEARSAEVLNH